MHDPDDQLSLVEEAINCLSYGRRPPQGAGAACEELALNARASYSQAPGRLCRAVRDLDGDELPDTWAQVALRARKLI